MLSEKLLGEISVADWLYGHTAARHIAPDRNAILVYGDDERADVLFDLLFATAFLPGAEIRLVRVATNGSALGERFLFNDKRDAEIMQHFANSELSAMDAPRRPLTVAFYDAGDEAWRNNEAYACAYVPSQAVYVPEIVLYNYGNISAAPDEQDWQALELSLPVLRLTQNIHTAYTMGWNPRYREEDIIDDLCSAADDYYALRSSLRLALSIPWKLCIARVNDAEGLFNRLQEKAPAIGGARVRDYLAWQEHRSWLAFMALDGWKAPEPDDKLDYVFKGNDDHRDKASKLHPCMCDIEDDWFAPHEKVLKATIHSEWSKAYSEEAAREPGERQYSKLDWMSLCVHHKCKEIALSDEYKRDMDERFSGLGEALIKYCKGNVSPHYERLTLLKNMFDRLLKNESNSYNPYGLACASFIREIDADRESFTDEGRSDVKAAFSAVQDRAKVAVERNRYCNYKESDSQIIDWLHWIIDMHTVQTVWRLYSRDDPLQNLYAALILRPGRLVLLSGDESSAPDDGELKRFQESLERYGLTQTIVESRSLLAEDCFNGDDGYNVVDESGARGIWKYMRKPRDAYMVYVDGDRLCGEDVSSNRAYFYRQRIPLTVDEVLHMKGETALSAAGHNDMLGMEEYCDQLWWCRTHTAPKDWFLLTSCLSAAEEEYSLPIYRRRDSNGAGQLFTRDIHAGDYERLIRNGCMEVLFALQSRGAVSDLDIQPPSDGAQYYRLSMMVYPKVDTSDPRHDGCAESRKAIDSLLDATKGSFAFDDEYVPDLEPLRIWDLSRWLPEEKIIEEYLRQDTSPDPTQVKRDRIRNKLTMLVNRQLLVSEGIFPHRKFQYISAAVRHGLRKAGSALEAWVYYSLFLSGRFDDIRSNVRVMTGTGKSGLVLEKEIDVIVTRGNRMGIISCKDTPYIPPEHPWELSAQAKRYGINAKPVLICYATPDVKIVRSCDDLGVTLIRFSDHVLEPEKRNQLVNMVVKAIDQR